MSEKALTPTTGPAASFSFSVNVPTPPVMGTGEAEPASHTGVLPLTAVRHLLSGKPLMRPNSHRRPAGA